MMILLITICLLLFVALIIVGALSPQMSAISQFELERRIATGDKNADAMLRRDALIPDIISLQKLFSALFLTILSLVLVATFGWLLGVLVAVLIAVEHGAISRLSFIQKKAQLVYQSHESKLLNFIERHQTIFRVIRSVTPEMKQELQLDSRDELKRLVAGAGQILSKDEQKLITHGLEFPAKRVGEIMTPRSMIDSISNKELLGPLVLNDLHKTGHSRFPVIDGDVDHVVGVLHIQDLLTLDSGKKSSTVEKTMSPRVFYIREDQPLDHALAAFLRTHHHLFIVINEFRETVGLLSLEDVVEALLGRKIIDDFDTHEDLRAVAARNPRRNNHPDKRHDV